jgi:hypothetical protein
MMNAIELRKLPLFAALGPDESSCLEHGKEISVAAGDFKAGIVAGSRAGDQNTRYRANCECAAGIHD